MFTNTGSEPIRISTHSAQRHVLALIVLLAVLFTTITTPSGNALGMDVNSNRWAQFRGPGGQGRALSRNVPVQWSESETGAAENIAWKVAVPGEGHSSPVVLDNQIWMTTALDDGKSLRALCFDLRDGKLLHNREVFTPAEPVTKAARNSFATPTPVIEPGRVYVHFGTMGTACLATDSGNTLWENRQFKIDHETGPAASPILLNNLFIVNFDGMNEQFVVALNKQDGTIAWKTDRSAPYRDDPVLRRAFSVPVVVDDEGQFQLVSVGADQTHAYNPLTGEEIWHVTYAGTSNIPHPLYGDGLVYIVTGFRSPELWAIRIDGHGDVTKTHVEWQYKQSVPTIPSPILVEEKIFMVNDEGICCSVHSKTGKRLWRSRLGGNFSASPVFVGGHVYFPSEEGNVTVIEPASIPKTVATNTISGRIMATPAIVDGALLIRTDQHLYRIENAE